MLLEDLGASLQVSDGNEYQGNFRVSSRWYSPNLRLTLISILESIQHAVSSSCLFLCHEIPQVRSFEEVLENS